MKQLSIFDFLQEVDATSTTAQAELQNQSNLSARITASTNTSEVEKISVKDVEDCALMRQWKEIKAQYPDALLLFRVGDFYEAYNEDAKDATKILGITLTKFGKSNIPMCGFPFHALDTYLPKLVREGKRVAICDQIDNVNRATKNLKKKQITQFNKL